MKKSLLALLFVLPAVGCIQLSKTGPLWGKDSSSGGGPTRSKTDPKAVIMPARDAGGPVIEEGGPRPPSPTFFVTPAEVNDVNAAEIAARLREEMQRDMNAEFPPYPVVSRIQR